MVEHTDTVDDDRETLIEIRRPAAAGQFVAFSGSDMARGETVLRAGQVLSSREIGMLAAVGCAAIEVWRKPRVAIISTGDEIIAPGAPMRPGAVFDSNAAILAAAVEEAGGVPCALGIGADDDGVLTRLVEDGLAACDMVLLSGGTSKGAGDLCYRAVARYQDPGIVVHGVALKPGKPLCLAVTGGKPVVVLPGFPTSAIFTFHEFVAPVIRAFAGLPPEQAERLPATLPLRIASERGRTEYLLVSLIRGSEEGALAAYPNAKGSGAVTAFSQADGFITIGAQVESVAAGTPVEVQLIGRAHLADLVIIGSHCVGLDILIDRLHADGIAVKALNGRQHGRACRREARRVRRRRDPPDGAGNRRVQSAIPDPGARTGAGVSPVARHRLSQPRLAFCGPVDRRRARDGIGGARLPDGQPERRQRHPHPDRPAAERSEAGRLLVAAEIAQRRRRRGRAGPRRLGDGDRKRGAPIRARLYPGAG